MSDFTARIKAELGSLTRVENQLKNLGKTEIKLTNISVGNVGLFTKALQNALNDMGLKIDFSKAESSAKSAAQNMSNAFTQSMNQASNAARGFNQQANTAAQTLVQMKSATLSNNMTTWLKNNDAAAAKFGGTLAELQTKLAGNNDPKFLTEANTQFKLIKSEAQAAGLATSGFAKQARQAAEETTKIRSATLSNQIESWMNKNTKAAAQYGDRLRELQALLRNNTEASKLTQIRAEFGRIKSEAQAAGLTTNSFVQSLKNIALQATGITTIGIAIRRVAQEIKAGINTVVELDTALVDLKKTSSMSNNELANYYYDANEIAKELGRTTQEIIQTSADWSRLGYGSYEDATRMSKMAAQFASISPGMNIEESTNTLVSVMKAFDVQTNDVLDGIMSKINIVGNNFALSNADLSAGLMNSSAAMAVANNTLEETIALITAGTEITQNASKVGNGLRTEFCAYVQKCA